MTKQEIINNLDKGRFKKGSLTEYERAKKLLINGPICATEYDHIIRVITEYLKI